MSVYFCGDPHLGHANIAKFRSFVNDSSHNTQLFLESCDILKKKDVVYFMGDVAFDLPSLQIIADLKCRKILIKGNHDDLVSTHDQAGVFEQIHGILKYKKFWLSHAPIHPHEIRGKAANIHGHVHNKSVTKKTWYGQTVLDPMYINTCVDVVYPKTGNMFLKLEDIKKTIGL